MHIWIISVLFLKTLFCILEISLFFFFLFSLNGMVSSSSTDSLVCVAVGT